MLLRLVNTTKRDLFVGVLDLTDGIAATPRSSRPL